MHQTYRRLIALTLCAGLITTAFSTQSEKLWQVSYADTTVSSDDQAQIDDLNNQYEELEEHQKEIQAQIDAAKSEKDKYLAEKNQLNGQIDNTQAQINVLTDKITLLDNMIAENNASIANLEEEIDKDYEIFRQRARASYMSGACLGAGSKLLRHQQDTAFPRLGAGADAGIQQGGFAAAGSAQNQFQHFGLLPLIDFCLYCNTKVEIKPPLFFAIPPPLWYTEKNILYTGKGLCMKILAVDYGDSRTGLATCDRTEFLTTAITPQITLKARNKVAARVCEVAKEIEAEMILIGLPLNMDGTEGERAAKSRKLAKTVELWSGLPVRMWDERQTTCAAADLLDESGTSGSVMVRVLSVASVFACVPSVFGVAVIVTKSPLASFWESIRLSR